MLNASSKTKHAPRQRDADATRLALLSAARAEFQSVGYESASTRQIATAAGCNVALISRYFGSKAGLFQTIMEECIDLTPLQQVGTSDMALALAEIALDKGMEPDKFDPLVVAIRSSGSATAKPIIREELGDPMVAALAALIGGEHAQQKAGVILSLISGVYVGRHAIDAQALSPEQDETVRTLLVASIDAILRSGTPPPAA